MWQWIIEAHKATVARDIGKTDMSIHAAGDLIAPALVTGEKTSRKW